MMLPVTLSSMADLVVEHYDYRYTPAGMPVIELTIKNPGTQEMHADLSVILSRAEQSAQNEYRYKDVGNMKTLRGVAILPGKEQQLIFRNVPDLKPGDYEATIRLQHLADAKLSRNDFHVSTEAVAQARRNRETNKQAPPGTSSLSSLTVWDVTIIFLACLIVLAGIRNWRKAVLTRNSRQGGSNRKGGARS